MKVTGDMLSWFERFISQRWTKVKYENNSSFIPKQKLDFKEQSQVQHSLTSISMMFLTKTH